MGKYYVHWNGSAWFVKTAEYFEIQGGLFQRWGRFWKPIEADSIEHARKKAEVYNVTKHEFIDTEDKDKE